MVLAYENDNGAQRLTCKIYYVESLEYTYVKSYIEEHDTFYNVKVYRIYTNDANEVLKSTMLLETTYPIPQEILNKEQEIIEEIN